jgi:gluconokinase
VGTTSAVRMVVDGDLPRVPDGLWCYRVDRQRSLVGGAMTEGGSLFAWIKQSFNFAEGTDFEALLAGVPADGHGLTFLPLLGGERCPGWVVGARGALMGLSFATTPAEILRAGLEGVTYRIALIYERLRKLIPGDTQIIASGGAIIRSPTWLQILADVLGKPVRPSRVAEASSRGTAILVLQMLGLLQRNRLGKGYGEVVYMPDDNRHARYEAARKRQEFMYHKLIQDRI